MVNIIIEFKFFLEINEESIKHALDLIRPKLEHQLSLVNKMKILESMSELDLNPIKSGEILLTDEFTEIINKEKEIINNMFSFSSPEN